jgi:hypothetical protein
VIGLAPLPVISYLSSVAVFEYTVVVESEAASR